MNQKILIKTCEGQVIYKGRFLDIPIKDDYIVKKSIELFDDDDPCIIHKSYCIKKIVEEMLILFDGLTEVKLNDYTDINFLKLPNEPCILIIGG